MSRGRTRQACRGSETGRMRGAQRLGSAQGWIGDGTRRPIAGEGARVACSDSDPIGPEAAVDCPSDAKSLALVRSMIAARCATHRDQRRRASSERDIGRDTKARSTRRCRKATPHAWGPFRKFDDWRAAEREGSMGHGVQSGSALPKPEPQARSRVRAASRKKNGLEADPGRQNGRSSTGRPNHARIGWGPRLDSTLASRSARATSRALRAGTAHRA
jgi:hypothetical protein